MCIETMASWSCFWKAPFWGRFEWIGRDRKACRLHRCEHPCHCCGERNWQIDWSMHFLIVWIFFIAWNRRDWQSSSQGFHSYQIANFYSFMVSYMHLHCKKTSERTNERRKAPERNQQCVASERVSDASKWASGVNGYMPRFHTVSSPKCTVVLKSVLCAPDPHQYLWRTQKWPIEIRTKAPCGRIHPRIRSRVCKMKTSFHFEFPSKEKLPS